MTEHPWTHSSARKLPRRLWLVCSLSLVACHFSVQTGRQPESTSQTTATAGGEARHDAPAVTAGTPSRAAAPTVRERERVTHSQIPAAPLAGDLTEEACHATLRSAGVRFTEVAKAKAPGVHYPIRITGPVGGVEIRGGKSATLTDVVDCRLATRLLAWAPTLRQAGVKALRHYSMYRKGAQVAGTTKRSAHAGGLAIDAARFVLDDGSVISVLHDWTDKRRGEDPCRPRSGEAEGASLMRDVVCAAAQQNLFQTIITPHYDAAHHNHVHLEITAAPKRTWIR